MKLCELCNIIGSAINEAMMDGFSYDALRSMRTFAERLRYCKRFLGMPIGNGSSRICFQIDDDKILKLAKNAKGLAQNEEEGRRDWFRDDYGLFPQVYYDMSDEDNYSYIVSEYVLPVKEKDFVHCLGMSSSMFYNFLEHCATSYSRIARKRFKDDKFEEMLENSEYLNSWYDFMCNYQFEPRDLRNANFGLALRDGDPTIVMLDSGLSDEIYDKFYKRK